ncbi:MAG: ABC transporter ATP-binding protein [Clostridia bacterium]|nr:ABC transporter ATP-binding protein [Clostridia bacterium]
MAKNVLKLENVTMQFGGVVAVNDLSLEVNEGEIIALIGPNGAGKTTAFNCITGVYEPTNGRISFNGETMLENCPHGKMKKLYAGTNAGKFTKVIRKTPDVITKMGIARTFQNIRLFKTMTVLENVLVACHMFVKTGVVFSMLGLGKKEEAAMRQQAMEYIRFMGLEDVADEIAANLPYGKQRHLEIARALAARPKLLLLDEPAAGMNPQETAELMELIRRIRDEFNLTVFMIEHHMDLVMGISDRIYVIDFGKQIAEGTPVEIQNNPAVIAAYLGEEEEA